MRDYTRFDANLSRLQQDVYAQPPDQGHIQWGTDAIVQFLEHLGPGTIGSVLDVGCGQAPFANLFQGAPWNIAWTGVTIGEDYQAAKKVNPNVFECDFSFLPFEDGQFDLVFARHALEHSPFPLLTLMEWRRVARKNLILVAPANEYWGPRGRNHYSVMTEAQLRWLLERSGWGLPILEQNFISNHPLFVENWNRLATQPGEEDMRPDGVTIEYRYLCEATSEVDA